MGVKQKIQIKIRRKKKKTGNTLKEEISPPKYIPMEKEKPLEFWVVDNELLRDLRTALLHLNLNYFFKKTTTNNKNKNKDFDENGLGFKKKRIQRQAVCVGFYQNQHVGNESLWIICFLLLYDKLTLIY